MVKILAISSDCDYATLEVTEKLNRKDLNNLFNEIILDRGVDCEYLKKVGKYKYCFMAAEFPEEARDVLEWAHDAIDYESAKHNSWIIIN